MNTCMTEECYRIDSDLPLPVLEDDSSGAGVDDDVEELRNSLKEIVQDQSVKPKIQCIMMDSSFSMVTVQSEESSIMWETASSSSRCSTPWTSEASTTSEAYSPGGYGTQGKITFIMDEDKIARRWKKTSRADKADRQRRSLPEQATGEDVLCGTERPAMTEISKPNLKSVDTDKNEESTEPLEDKEQKLFNIVSEGYEILNIVVPSHLPTVDEEESTEMADNLFYLENNQTLKSNPETEETEAIRDTSDINILDVTKVEEGLKNVELTEEIFLPTQSLDSSHSFHRSTGVDYFEKFTLLDEKNSSTEEQFLADTSEEEETFKNQEQAIDGMPTFVSDLELASEHFDDVFYGSSYPDEVHISHEMENFSEEKEKEEQDVDERDQTKSPLKENGSALFGSQELILSPIFLSPGPPRIIDPALLEEPTAMSFLYTDLYAEAVGSRTRDEQSSETESITSDSSFEGRCSDADEAGGYLEKFILKDETSVVESEPEPADVQKAEGTTSQTQSELTDVLIRVEEEVEEDDTKAVEGSCKNNAQPLDNQSEEVMKPEMDLYNEGLQSIDETKESLAKEMNKSTALEDKKKSMNDLNTLKGLPVPQKPLLQPQAANSATSTSVTVRWKGTEGDTVDCFQVHWKEQSQGATCENCTVTVKENWCTLGDLGPDKNYEVWVTAVNHTGCSPPSDKKSFRTGYSSEKD